MKELVTELHLGFRKRGFLPIVASTSRFRYRYIINAAKLPSTELSKKGKTITQVSANHKCSSSHIVSTEMETYILSRTHLTQTDTLCLCSIFVLLYNHD